MIALTLDCADTLNVRYFYENVLTFTYLLVCYLLNVWLQCCVRCSQTFMHYACWFYCAQELLSSGP